MHWGGHKNKTQPAAYTRPRTQRNRQSATAAQRLASNRLPVNAASSARQKPRRPHRRGRGIANPPVVLIGSHPPSPIRDTHNKERESISTASHRRTIKYSSRRRRLPKKTQPNAPYPRTHRKDAQPHMHGAWRYVTRIPASGLRTTSQPPIHVELPAAARSSFFRAS